MFFGVLGLATLALYHFMDTGDETSIYHAIFSGFLIALGGVLLLVGRNRRPLPEGFVTVAQDLALPMAGWTVMKGRGWTNQEFGLTTATLQEPVPNIETDEALNAYATSVATKMNGALVSHSRANLSTGTPVVSMQLGLAETNCTQVLIPRHTQTQIVAITHPDPAAAAERGEWVLRTLMDLRR
jgi:hypothetical protein